MRQTTRASLVPNPPWVSYLLSVSYEAIQDQVKDHPAWMPKLAQVFPGRGNRISAEIREYGCGVYGCVIPTLDPNVVLKVTTDDTEAQFAAEIAHDLVAPICVRYLADMALTLKHRGRSVTLLWRESADYVGNLAKYLSERVRPESATEITQVALTLIANQWDAAQIAFKALVQHASPDDKERAVSGWLEACEKMARQTRVPELRSLGDGMVEIFAAQGVVFGDVHAGNIGLVHRPDGDRWVITDPGNIAVVLPT